MSDAERKALAVLRMLQPADILEYVDCIASTRKENKAREKRLVGMLCALADARAALDA